MIALPSNDRRTGRENGVKELAASIAAHGFLQSPVVRPVNIEARSKKDEDRLDARWRSASQCRIMTLGEIRLDWQKGHSLSQSAPLCSNRTAFSK